MKSLHNLSYKTLFTILFLALAGIVFFLKIGGKTQKVSAAWWNDSWHYRQSINISSHTSLESNVYITTAINIGSTTKAQIDGGDFRFISQSGENLSYYIVSGAGTTNVSFDILIPSFPANTSTIYAYYGNSTIENGFSAADFSTQAANYTIGSLSTEEVGGGPIAYWKFDEGVGTTIYDSTSNNHNGTLQNGTSWASEDQCVSGKCLQFDGVDDYVNAGTGTNYLPMNTFSMCAWAKTSGLASGMSLNGIMSYTYGLTMYLNSSGNFVSRVDNGTNIVSVSETSQNLYDNKFHHLCFTFDGTNRYMYIDGNLKKTAATTWNNRYTTNTVNIGHENNSSTIYKFNGLIDEPKIYNYARTADQIKQDYNSRGSLSGSSANLGVQSSTAPDLNSSLIAYWKFNENNGNTTYDSSGNNFNGTFIGNTKPTWISGKSKSGVGFSGVGDYINTSFQPTFREALTISVWIKRTTNFNQNTDVYIASPPNAWYFYDSYASGNIRGDVYIDGTRRAAITLPIPFDNNWYHVVYTYNSSTHTAKMYKNGKLYQSSDLTSLGLSNYLIDLATGTMKIGNNSNSLNRGIFFDELKIYNTALTDEQIKQDYNGGSAIQFGSTNQTIGGTTTSLDYCIPGDTTYCAPPVAEWKMDEGVGTSIVDTSGNSNTGTISGATWSQGKIGKSLSFNGSSDHVNIGTLNSQNTFTLSAWIKANPSSNSDYRTILDKNISLNDRNFWFALENTTSKLSLRFSIGNNGNTFIANTPLNDDKWHYVTATYDNSYVKLYVDGKIDMTPVAISGIPDSATTTSYISRQGSGRYFFGSIDHVKIYNYARTPAQIAYDYNRGGPIGWWKMDECQGSTIYDWSGNGNNGTLTIGSNGIQNSIGTCQIGTSAAWTNGATGKFNSSLNFDGIDDYVWLGNNSLFCPKNITVSSWFKAPSNSTGTIVRNRGSGFGLNLASGTVNTYVYQATGSNLGTSTSTTYGNNLWHNAIMTYDGTTIKLYVDGILKNSQIGTGSGTIYCSGNALGIGRDADYSGSYFTGQIDDVRIYNYALTPDQIKQVYNGGAVNFN